MRTPRIGHQNGAPGIVWFVLPMVWAAIALAGFTLIANWPELFAQEQPAAAVAAVPAAHAGAELFMPQAGNAPAPGASTAQQAAQPVDPL